MANDRVSQIPIGDYIYLWTDPDHRKRKCIITAHGGKVLFGSKKPMGRLRQNPTLHFYSRHGQVTPGEGVNVFANMQPVETIQATGSPERYLCPDYHLTKYTNGFTVVHGWSKHNEGHETYHSVRYAAGYEDYDVVTIRSRLTPTQIGKSQVGILFSEVLNELANAGYTYNEVYCAFCRGRDD